MKNFSFLALSVGLLLVSSCKEKGPNIDFGGNAKATDTTYTATVETASAKKVLVEEFTGASCTNCPAAAKSLENLMALPENIDRIVVISMHIDKPSQIFKPNEKSKYDFRTQKGTDLCNLIYPGLGNIPIAGIDRVPDNGNTLIDKPKWASIIDTRKAKASPANIHIESSFDAASKTATVKVKIAYTSPISAKQYLTVAIMEDSIVDAQEFPSLEIDTAYVFRHTLRDYLTPVAGSEILSNFATKEAGRVYERTFVYKVNDAWKPDHCEFVAILHNNTGTDKEVLQAEEKMLK